jgi:hypothetical protein
MGRFANERRHLVARRFTSSSSGLGSNAIDELHRSAVLGESGMAVVVARATLDPGTAPSPTNETGSARVNRSQDRATQSRTT